MVVVSNDGLYYSRCDVLRDDLCPDLWFGMILGIVRFSYHVLFYLIWTCMVFFFKVGCTPLHRAASTGNSNVCELLIEEGADIDAVDRAGQTPLMTAVICENKEVKLTYFLFKKSLFWKAMLALFSSTIFLKSRNVFSWTLTFSSRNLQSEKMTSKKEKETSFFFHH